MNEEVWSVYPEFDFIEGSNLGRVRTVDRVVKCGNHAQFVKGRILKQQLDRCGYLFTDFRVNGKKVNRKVHRIIAQTFLPNPDNLPQVNHINCNKTENNVDNLEWCTPQYNITYREKYGKALSRPVFAINLNTFEILRFPSRAAAAHSLGVYSTSISAVIRGKLKQAGGFWFTEDESKITKEKLQSIKDNMYFLGGVIAINLEATKVLRFRSCKEAADSLKCSSGNIVKVVKGRYNYTCGFWFTYANDHAVESVRKKFGNSVANKVAELVNEK